MGEALRLNKEAPFYKIRLMTKVAHRDRRIAPSFALRFAEGLLTLMGFRFKSLEKEVNLI